MMTKLTGAILAGLVFGILIGITAALPCLIIVSFFLMLILGVVAVYLARGDIKSAGEALMASGIAGGISGIIGAVSATIWLALIVLLSNYMNAEGFSIREFSGLGIYGLICAPVLIVSGILLAAIGGYIYYEMVAKKGK
ncbi:hypothetical protein [Methanocella sp. MCL-LM]|uniref:hypothetical protein n=1 Tax=Methanocella sp. MCL-LM TaxID=3412035 RepID=UPI003C76F927